MDTIETLKQKIRNLREPLETWLVFYDITGTILNEEQLISNIMIKITEYREYSYKQNEEFERLLQKELTGKNEKQNDRNWKKITNIYNEKMPQVMELLGKTYEDHGFEENWNTLHNQSKNIIIKMINIKKLIEKITSTPENEKGIFEMIEDIMAHLQLTGSIYDDIINGFIELNHPFIIDKNESKLNTIRLYIIRIEAIVKNELDYTGLIIEINDWFKNIINRYAEELQEKPQDNFKITIKIITTLEEQIQKQDDQIKDQQDQINRLQEQLQDHQIQLREWRNLALSLSNTTVNCERHNIL